MGARKVRLRHAAIAGALAVSAAGALGQAPRLSSLLSGIEPGLWQVRPIDGSPRPPMAICLGDPGVFLQLEHRQTDCKQMLVSNDSSGIVVNYTCPANSFGRTQIRVETPRLINIDSQGIEGGMPFAFRSEARRLGPCPGIGTR